MRQFLVSCVDEGIAVHGHRAALASLPAHFRLVTGERADVTVSASSADLPAGVRAVVVTNPGAARVAAIPVFPAWAFLPRLEADACFLKARECSFSLISCTTTVAGIGMARMRTALLEQLAILRSLTGLNPTITALTSNETGYTASADLDAKIVALASVISPHGRDTLRLSAVGSADRLDVAIDSDAIARPASIRLFGHEGVREAMPIHQSSHRLTWSKVHELLSDLSTMPSTAAISDGDFACVSQWLSSPDLHDAVTLQR